MSIDHRGDYADDLVVTKKHRLSGSLLLSFVRMGCRITPKQLRRIEDLCREEGATVHSTWGIMLMSTIIINGSQYHIRVQDNSVVYLSQT